MQMGRLAGVFAAHLLKEWIYSHTPDRDFCCFYPCEIILSHIPVPAREKGKNRTAARRQYAGRTLIRDVIKMLK